MATDWEKRIETLANKFYLDSDLALLDMDDCIGEGLINFALIVLREFAEEAAEFADRHPDQMVSVGESGSGQFRAWSTVGNYIRSMLPAKKED